VRRRTATAHQVRGYRLVSLGYGFLMALVPLVAGTIIRSVGERSWPWFAVAAIATVIAVVGGLSAHPSQFCF
jgi:hypothetical protein